MYGAIQEYRSDLVLTIYNRSGGSVLGKPGELGGLSKLGEFGVLGELLGIRETREARGIRETRKTRELAGGRWDRETRGTHRFGIKLRFRKIKAENATHINALRDDSN